MNGAGEPSAAALSRARDEFASLLADRTPEAVWQRFFAQNPYILSSGLPLQLLPCDILPLGRNGRSEPDFLLYPGSAQSSRVHGIVELKTNFAKISTQPRKTELILSRDAASAVSQVTTYDALYDSFAPTRRILTLETISHLFVIMGDLSELLELEETSLQKLLRQIPPGIRFLTFNELFDAYSGNIPKPVSILYPKPELIGFEPSPQWPSATMRMVAARLHRVVSEAFSFYDLGGSQVRQINFARWIDQLFQNPPQVRSRFQPSNRPVLYAAPELSSVLAEMEWHRRTNDIADRLSRTRYRHFEFEFRGRMLSIGRGSTLAEQLMTPDYAPASNFASEVASQGYDGVIYPSLRGPGELFAIFRRDGIGRVVSDRLLARE